ncbi:MAG: alkaline phosphatase family protein [Microlunatus sp.]|nr:alkaline phosphatase family protein [Microlunatus sp.]
MKVCLVGIDGLRLDLAQQEAETFRRLAAVGSLAAMTIDVPTISGPSWTTLLTGAAYAEHKIIDNTFAGGRNAELPDFLSKIAAADPRIRTFAGAAWLPLVDPAGPGPVIHARAGDQRLGRHTVLCRDSDGGDYAPADAEITTAASAAIAEGVDASFVYLGEADAAAHAYGGLSPQYRAAIGRIDDHLRSLVGAVAERATGTGENWVLAVTTDHGQLDAGGHGGGSELETTSFALACCFGPGTAIQGAGPRGWPERMQPTELSGRLIGFAAGAYPAAPPDGEKMAR